MPRSDQDDIGLAVRRVEAGIRVELRRYRWLTVGPSELKALQVLQRLEPISFRDRFGGHHFLGRVAEPDTGVPDGFPTELVPVASVHRIRKHSLPHVADRHVHEVGAGGMAKPGQFAGLEGLEQIVLLFVAARCEMETGKVHCGLVQTVQSLSVGRRVILGIPGQGIFQVPHDANLGSTGQPVVGGEEPLEQGGGGFMLTRRKDRGRLRLGHRSGQVAGCSLRLIDSGANRDGSIERMSDVRCNRNPHRAWTSRSKSPLRARSP